jgi:hypothetical protein
MSSEYTEGFQAALELIAEIIEKVGKAIREKKLDKVKRELGLANF